MVEKVSGKKLRFEEGARRAGDPAALIAEGEKIRRVLDWASSHE
jgi:UDP-glucose 4-epimerase